MIKKIRKRNGEIVDFHQEKITRAIFKAARACGGDDYSKAEKLSDEVMNIIEKTYIEAIPNVEDIQDVVEKVLIENGHAKTAKAYILYREKRKGARETNALIGGTIEMFSKYLGDKATMINDDKPLIHISNKIIVYGTPYDGKHRLSTNTSVPLKSISLLKYVPEAPVPSMVSTSTDIVPISASSFAANKLLKATLFAFPTRYMKLVFVNFLSNFSSFSRAATFTSIEVGTQKL